MTKFLAILVLVSAVGCSSRAGPFITSISSDGADGLVVEKCMAKFDPWMSTVNNDSCTTTQLKLRAPAGKQ